jgi:hypothetical protein
VSKSPIFLFRTCSVFCGEAQLARSRSSPDSWVSDPSARSTRSATSLALSEIAPLPSRMPMILTIQDEMDPWLMEPA